MINVLYVSHSSHLGGAERCLLTLLQNIDRSRVNPFVVLPGRGPIEKELKKLDVETAFLNIPWAFHGPGPHDTQSILGRPGQGIDWSGNPCLKAVNMSIARFSERSDVLRKLIANHSAQLVHSNTITMLEVGLIAHNEGIPHICHVHESIVGHPNLESCWPDNVLKFLLKELCDLVIVPSKWLRKILLQYLDSDRCDQVYNGVADLDAMSSRWESPEVLRRKFEIDSGISLSSNVVCSIGSSSAEKGWVYAVGTADKIRAMGIDTTFLLVGPTYPGSSSFTSIDRAIRNHQLENMIYLTGYRDDVADIMAMSDVVFQPSIMDCLPVVVAEAMSLKKPVVGTFSGGMAEMIDDGVTGLSLIHI